MMICSSGDVAIQVLLKAFYTYLFSQWMVRFARYLFAIYTFFSSTNRYQGLDHSG